MRGRRKSQISRENEPLFCLFCMGFLTRRIFAWAWTRVLGSLKRPENLTVWLNFHSTKLQLNWTFSKPNIFSKVCFYSTNRFNVMICFELYIKTRWSVNHKFCPSMGIGLSVKKVTLMTHHYAINFASSSRGVRIISPSLPKLLRNRRMTWEKKVRQLWYDAERVWS